MRTLHIASRSQWEVALGQLEAWFISKEIDAAIQSKLFIAFDEIVSNIFNHNSQEIPIEIEVTCEKKPTLISLSFTDNCKLFNPLNSVKKEPDAIGGWGLDIVKQLMDDIEYKVVDNKNCLTVKKQIL